MPNLLLTMWDTIKSSNIGILVAAGLGMFVVIGGLSMLSYHYTLSGIKSRTVGDGQHGTARWATDKEIRQTYAHVPFKVRDWRKGVSLPTEQGLVLGCKGKKDELTALVDSDDIHCLMIAASGAGKTAFFLYPNLEYVYPNWIFSALLFRNATLKRSAIIGFGMSTFIEFAQYFIMRNTAVDDIILNTLGAICGYWVYRLLRKMFPGFSRKFICNITQAAGN